MKATLAVKDPLIHFPFYINQYQGILSRYSLEEKGAFISLLCVFLSEDGNFPDDENQIFRMCLAFSEGEKKAVLSIKEKVVETGREILKSQRQKRQKCREAASKGGLARVANAQANATETLKRHSSNTETENREQRTEIETKKDIKPKGFIKPTLEEIQAYCQERQNTLDAKRLFDYYETSGWKDKDGKPVKNWKQKIITWEGRNNAKTPQQSQSSYLNSIL